jgi:hypothetical protein
LLSHQRKRERKKKESAHCCQSAVARGVIYADLRGELSTHLALKALFTQSSVWEPLLQAFPFPSTLGEVTLHPLSQTSVFIYSSCGKWVFSPLLWSFLPTATFTSFPTPGCWAGAATRAFSGQLVYLQFCEGLPLPLLQHSGCPALFAMCLFCCCCLLFSFFSFFPRWGRSNQGAILIWPRVVCGSTVYCLAHFVVCVFPSGLGAGIWRSGGSAGALLVSPFNVEWGCYARGGGLEESKFCLFSVVFPVRCISRVSPRFYFRRHAFCFLPLVAILESLMFRFQSIHLSH